ncbi:NADH dehydrogenase [ubiquinone] 1 beta subcomplex subunit 11, mitochondrial [Prorops nasuta]|uniref:NADH dehydrogenase [ubiquinone] 1 beta subcomplex subunit 11, mitochondrial n=1 Tax=Prorops nasuta TaxID=863751 RepID=UPI0034CD6DC0
MAALIKIGINQGLNRNLILLKNNIQICRTMSKIIKTDEVTIHQPQPQPPKKYFVSYGYDDEDPVKDRALMHATYFLGITLGIVFGGFLLVYMPKNPIKRWAEREAYLQLRYREEKGLPLVDPNYVDPEVLLRQMPSDEEIDAKGLRIII